MDSPNAAGIFGVSRDGRYVLVQDFNRRLRIDRLTGEQRELEPHFSAAGAYWRETSKELGAPVKAAIVNTASGVMLGNGGQTNYTAAKAGGHHVDR